MYDRIAKHRDSFSPERDFAQPVQGEGLNGAMLFYIALAGSGAIFVLFLMINAVAVH